METGDCWVVLLLVMADIYKCICISLLGCCNTILQKEWPKQQKLTFSNSGAWKSKIKVSAGLLSSEVSLPALQMAATYAGIEGTYERPN